MAPIGNRNERIKVIPMESREIAEKAQEWKERAEDVADQARDWQETAKQRARQTGRVVHEYVQGNAWMSVGIAAAVGLVIGLLISRDRD